MSDRDFKIKITTEADTSGMERQAQALGKTADAEKTVAQAAKQQTRGVEEAQTALAGMKLPEGSNTTFSQVSAAAEAYTQLANAMRDAIENYNSVSAAHARHVAELQAELELEKQLLETHQAKELSLLEQAKAPMSAGDYAKRKHEIDARYVAAGSAAENKTGQPVLAAESVPEAQAAVARQQAMSPTIGAAEDQPAAAAPTAQQVGTPLGQMIGDVSAVESAFQYGQNVTVKQQAEINALTSLLQSHDQNADVVLKALGQLWNNTDALTKRVNALMQKWEAQAQQIRQGHI